MARPRTVSDEEILLAARAAFLEHGGAVATGVIADAVGLSQAALFKRFGTKKGLLLAALAPPAIAPFVEHLGEAPDPALPVRGQIEEIMERALLFFRDLVPCVMVLTTSGLGPREMMDAYEEPPIVVTQLRVAKWLAAGMEQGRIRPGDPDAMATLLLAPMHLRAFRAGLTREPFDDRAARAHVHGVLDCLWHGLAPSPDQESSS